MMVSAKKWKDEGADFIRCGSFISIYPGKTGDTEISDSMVCELGSARTENHVKP